MKFRCFLFGIILCSLNVSYAGELPDENPTTVPEENTPVEAGAASKEIGMVLATMNTALVYKGNGAFEILMRDKIKEKDAFETGEWARLKLLLLDGTTVTLDANTKMSIDGYDYSEDSGGNTSFTLYEGFMRLIAGKTFSTVNTDDVEITTSGASVEIVSGVEDHMPFTGIACLDGEVKVSVKEQRKTIKLGRNQILTVVRGEKSLKPMDMKETGVRVMSGKEIADLREVTARNLLEKEIETAATPDTALPPVNQQPIAITPVSVVVSFP